MARGGESSSCAPARGKEGFFENLSHWGKFLKILPLGEVFKIVTVGKFLKKSIRKRNLVLFIINYRI
jgi:hypothetical protein